jgi:hypothetical protein
MNSESLSPDRADPVHSTPLLPPGTPSVPDPLTPHQFRVLATLALYRRLKKQVEGCHYQLMKFEGEQSSEQGGLTEQQRVSAVYDRAGGGADGQWLRTLKTLVRYGMLKTRPEIHRKRARVAYSITEVGEIAAHHWMDEAEELLRRGNAAFPNRSPQSGSADPKVMELQK